LSDRCLPDILDQGLAQLGLDMLVEEWTGQHTAEEVMALLQAQGKDTPEMESLQKREELLLRLNLVFGVFVLLLTAIARSA